MPPPRLTIHNALLILLFLLLSLLLLYLLLLVLLFLLLLMLPLLLIQIFVVNAYCDKTSIEKCALVAEVCLGINDSSCC